MHVKNVAGGYAFTPSELRFASGGVVALQGMAIEHARFPLLVPLHDGFEFVRRHMEQIGRPLAALCGFELRIPHALAWGGFDTFNLLYSDRLAAWDLLREDGTSPLARSNVAPFVNPPDQPSISAISYTIEAEAGPTFVVSGVAELREPFRMPIDVVRGDDTSHGALVEKARSVVEIVEARLKALGVAWDDSVSVHMYTRHDLVLAVKRELLAAIGVTPAYGVVWHDAAPPVRELEFEIDVRRHHREVVLWPRT